MGQAGSTQAINRWEKKKARSVIYSTDQKTRLTKQDIINILLLTLSNKTFIISRPVRGTSNKSVLAFRKPKITPLTLGFSDTNTLI